MRLRQPGNHPQYEATQINWARLNKYARDVASSTTRPATARTCTVTYQEAITTTTPRGWFRSDLVTTTYEPREKQVPVTGPCWVLDERYAKYTSTQPSNGRGRPAEVLEDNRTLYCLNPGGALVVVSYSTLEQFIPRTQYGGSHYQHSISEKSTTRPMRDDDVELFDFHPMSRLGSRGPREKVDRTDMASDRRKYDSKGVGLSVALKRLLS